MKWQLLFDFTLMICFVFPAPFQPAGGEAAGEVCVQDGVDFNGQAFVALIDQVIEVLLNIIFQDHGGRYFTGALAAWTDLAGIDIGFRLHALAGDLHQSEFRDRQNGVLGPVEPHELVHGIRQFLFYFQAVSCR